MLLCTLSACNPKSGVTTAPPTGTKPVTTKQPEPAVITTADEIFVPHLPRLEGPQAVSPDTPDKISTLLQQGYGALDTVAGQAPLTRTLPGDAPPPSGAHPWRMTRFVHLSDLQLADDESPSRVATLDSTGQTDGAYRAQEGYGCIMVNAAIHTINRINANDPLGFVLMGGDNADNAQWNEESWVLDLMRGGAIECDSGNDDDPVPGPGNDPKDPFVAEGLEIPFKWVTGNHDVLVQGNVPPLPPINSTTIGGDAPLGTRDYSLPGAPIVTGTVPADPRRHLLQRRDLMALIAGDGDGHGLGAANVESGRAFYTFDIEGSPLRFIVLDFAAETGGDAGIVHQPDLVGFIKPQLDQAQAEGKLVVLTSHHAQHTLTTDGGELGVSQADAVKPSDYAALLAQYPNIVLSLVGHSHHHQVNELSLAPTRTIWEVMTSALADYPNQFRIVEIWDEDNGWLTIRTVCVNYDNPLDPLVAEGRKLATADFNSGWGLDGRRDATHTNVILWVKKPTLQ